MKDEKMKDEALSPGSIGVLKPGQRMKFEPCVSAGLRVYGKDIDDSVPGIRVVDLHKDAVIIGVALVQGRTTLWLAGSGKGETVKVRILLATSGMAVPEEAVYIGSVGNGAYVMHVLKPVDQEITHTRP